MSTITVQTGEIEEYQGDETAPLLRIFVSKTFVASDGDTIMRSSFEEGEFYKEEICAVASGIVTYPAFTIDSTEDALSNPQDTKYRFDLFTAAGIHIQNVHKNIIVPTTTPTTLGDLALASEDAVPAGPASAYTQAQSDARYIQGNGIAKIAVSTSEPVGSAVGDMWLDSDN